MPSKNLQPALVGGLFIGVLSALPIIKVGNCFCCLWVIGGGIVTAYLMQNASAVAITVGDGAVGGLIAGLIGAVVNAVLSIPLYLIMAPLQSKFMQQFMDNAQDMPPGMRDFIHSMMMGGSAGLAITFVTSLMFGLVVGAIFATVGGMIGAAIFSRGKPSVMAGPPMAPPPPSPASPIPPSPPPPPQA